MEQVAKAITTEKAAPMAQAPLATTLPQASFKPRSLPNITVQVDTATGDMRFAEGLSRSLRLQGFTISQTRDLKPHKQRRNVILYRDGYYKQALALSRTFAIPPAVVNNTHKRRANDTSTVRLILGNAAPHVTVVARLDVINSSGR